MGKSKGNTELFELANTLRKAPPKEVQFYLDAKVRDLFLSWVGWPDPILETKTINRQLVGKTAHLCTGGITRKLANFTTLSTELRTGE